MMLTIVWDVDDVLNDLMYQWFKYSWLPANPDCNVTYAELNANPPHQALGTTREEYLASLDVFRRTERALKMQPNEAVLSWLHDHGARFRHVALTARTLETAPDVASWVMRHFGTWIRCFGVVPSRAAEAVPVYDRNKGEFLRWLRCGDILIDDSPENIRHAEVVGLKTLMYPQPWNESSFSVETLLQKLCEWAVES
jgi:hypothetical protein